MTKKPTRVSMADVVARMEASPDLHMADVTLARIEVYLGGVSYGAMLSGGEVDERTSPNAFSQWVHRRLQWPTPLNNMSWRRMLVERYGDSPQGLRAFFELYREFDALQRT